MPPPKERPRLSDTKTSLEIERVQTGVRMGKRMVKVLKALAEYHDMSLGDLLEGIVLHVFENRLPFSEKTLRHIVQLKEVYGMNYDASMSHKFTESIPPHEERRGRKS
ncbi:hypothetical protein HYR54_13505 [Candidatus Acetothermia bacterium]|nr:hypothetical protein [Candidatus Acetothermia bacterium]